MTNHYDILLELLENFYCEIEEVQSYIVSKIKVNGDLEITTTNILNMVEHNHFDIFARHAEEWALMNLVEDEEELVEAVLYQENPDFIDFSSHTLDIVFTIDQVNEYIDNMSGDSFDTIQDIFNMDCEAFETGTCHHFVSFCHYGLLKSAGYCMLNMNLSDRQLINGYIASVLGDNNVLADEIQVRISKDYIITSDDLIGGLSYEIHSTEGLNRILREFAPYLTSFHRYVIICTTAYIDFDALNDIFADDVTSDNLILFSKSLNSELKFNYKHNMIRILPHIISLNPNWDITDNDTHKVFKHFKREHVTGEITRSDVLDFLVRNNPHLYSKTDSGQYVVLSDSQLKKVSLPNILYPDPICSICHNDLSTDTEIVICCNNQSGFNGHTTCLECSAMWFKHQSRCPISRNILF